MATAPPPPPGIIKINKNHFKTLLLMVLGSWFNKYIKQSHLLTVGSPSLRPQRHFLLLNPYPEPQRNTPTFGLHTLFLQEELEIDTFTPPGQCKLPPQKYEDRIFPTCPSRPLHCLRQSDIPWVSPACQPCFLCQTLASLRWSATPSVSFAYISALGACNAGTSQNGIFWLVSHKSHDREQLPPFA